MGWNSAENRTNALIQAKNKADELEGNAIYLISNTTDSDGGVMVGNSFVTSSSATVQAEVCFCNFKKQTQFKKNILRMANKMKVTLKQSQKLNEGELNLSIV